MTNSKRTTKQNCGKQRSKEQQQAQRELEELRKDQRRWGDVKEDEDSLLVDTTESSGSARPRCKGRERETGRRSLTPKKCDRGTIRRPPVGVR
jgi:hypothetical protein